MKVQGVDPLKQVGTYVAPTDWNASFPIPKPSSSTPEMITIRDWDVRWRYRARNKISVISAWVQANRERLEGAEKLRCLHRRYSMRKGHVLPS